MSRRICFVCPRIYGYFNPEAGYTGGGAERQFHLLSTALADRFDVHAVVADYGQPKRESSDGVTLHRAYPLQPRQSPFQPAKHFALLGAAMRRADADLYFHRGRPRNAAFVFFLSSLLGRKWLYHIANDAYIDERPDELSWPIRWLFRRAVRGATTVVAQTAYQQRRLRERFGVASTIVPNGYPSAPQPRPHTDRGYVLWVGRLDRAQKRPHRYLDVAQRLPDETFRLVGPVDDTDPYQRSIRERAAELSNVQFVGPVSPREVHEQYRGAKLLVNTSAYEGFPNTFLEAWRQGTPVVSLDVDPVRYGIDDECCADGDVDRFERLIADLCSNLQRRHRLGRNARQHFESNFQLSTVASQYDAVISAALSN